MLVSQAKRKLLSREVLESLAIDLYLKFSKGVPFAISLKLLENNESNLIKKVGELPILTTDEEKYEVTAASCFFITSKEYWLKYDLNVLKPLDTDCEF